ncbi:transposase [Ellagibacter isourolithinifaciens]|uniref:transposase n=1 Tax=Ellagibacter isourolithinifaciens TaxID=2137581 RepID=UPI003AB04AFE
MRRRAAYRGRHRHQELRRSDQVLEAVRLDDRRHRRLGAHLQRHNARAVHHRGSVREQDEEAAARGLHAAANGLCGCAAVYDFASKEIVAWSVSTRPNMAQQYELLDQLLAKMPEGSAPVLHSDMGWQYQQAGWCNRLAEAGVVQSMSRKGNCIDNGATEQVFGHMKDEFFKGRSWASFEEFKRDLGAYIVHWNTRRRQVKLKGLTPEEFRNQSLAA